MIVNDAFIQNFAVIASDTESHAKLSPDAAKYRSKYTIAYSFNNNIIILYISSLCVFIILILYNFMNKARMWLYKIFCHIQQLGLHEAIGRNKL